MTEVIKAPNGQNLHAGHVTFGQVHVGETVEAIVNKDDRKSIIKNHSATHLLHAALKEVLGTHVNQAGSLVESDRLRFDFSHFGQVTQEELETIEKIVNEKIWQNIPVVIEEMPIEQAKEKGAMALFGEKYGDVVRVVEMSSYSIELCGGIHVRNTSEIGIFKIVSESGTGAGVRRIEAVTGRKAYETLKETETILKDVMQHVKIKDQARTIEKIEQIQQHNKDLEKEVQQKNKTITELKSGNIEDSVEEINGIKVLSQLVEAENPKVLRSIMDDYKSKMQDTVLLLASVNGDKVSLVSSVPKDLTDKVKAGDIIREAAPITNGKGGGRPDMAQGGGTDPSKVTEALQFVKDYIKTL